MKARLILGDVQLTLRYARALRKTPPGQREGLPRLRWWNLPLCWVSGHRHGRRGVFEISPYRLEFCSCCGEEVAGRAAWSQIEPRPLDDDDMPWDWDGEEDAP